jgi:hypothetical protein
MTTFAYGDIVRCKSALATTTGPLKLDALYVVEAVATHGKSIKVAGDWHSVNRFDLVGKSDLKDEDSLLYAKMEVNHDHLKQAADSLMGAFDWESSDEGYAFWSTVYDRLIDYADRFKVFKAKNEAA